MKKAFLLLPICFYATTFFAQPGSLDLTFDGDGTVITGITGVDQDYANAIAMQSDGKLVIAGYTMGGDTDFSLIRLNTDGSFDNTFDTDGKMAVDFGGYDQFASAVAIQSDGKIVAAGTTHNGLNNDIMLVRFNADGSLDNTFDGDGIRIIDVGISTDYGRGVAIQSDGKIVVVGYTNDNPTSDFLVIRLNSDGTFDTSFDTDGIVLTDIDTNDDYARSVAIQSDGKIVVAGNGYTGFDSDFVAARYNTDGSLDNTFNFDGKLFTDFSGGLDDIGNAVAIHTDGTIVISGYASNSIDNDFAVAKYTTAGMLDVSFSTDGKVVTDIGGMNLEDFSYGCDIFNDGKIIVTGSGSDGGPTSMTLVCYNTDGSLATAYDGDGKILTNVMNETFSSGVVIQPDGKFVVAGNGYGFAGSDYVIARYEGEGCSLNTNVLVTGLTLTADAFGFDYQWVDCDDNYSLIAGETNQTFNAASAGNYAVIMTDGTCIDTSDCYTVDDCNLNVDVTQNGFSLTADAAGLSYQWVDCTNNYSEVPFQSFQTFNVINPGNYAVIITDGGCSDTSDCYLVSDVGFDENNNSFVTVFPNPVKDDLTIQLTNQSLAVSLKITDVSGRIIYQKENLSGTSFKIDLFSQPDGIYFLEVLSDEMSEQVKIIKE